MRLGRIILASLAPLIGFSAMMHSPSADAPETRQDSIIRLFHTALFHHVAQMAMPDSEGVVLHSAPSRASLHAFLPVSALRTTALGHSLWMIAAGPVPAYDVRRPHLTPLRC